MRRAWMIGLVALGCADGTDTGKDTDVMGETDDSDVVETDDDTDAGDTTFTVGGTVSGLDGEGLTLRLNDGAPLGIVGNVAFTFPQALDDGSDYVVTVGDDPRCPAQACTVTNGSGSVDGSNVSDVTIDCGAPELTLVAANWWFNERVDLPRRLFFTDDVASFGSDDTPTPRVVGGDLTDIDDIGSIAGLAVDAKRDRIYVANGDEIRVFDGLTTADADRAPVATWTLANIDEALSLCLDPTRDILYVTANGTLAVVQDASTRTDGAGVADALVSLNGSEDVEACALDVGADRLFVGGSESLSVFVFDAASSLTNTATPDRTLSWTDEDGPDFLTNVALDACHDRLWLASRSASPGGYNLFALDDAATLDGVIDLDETADARIAGETMPLEIDPEGRLWFGTDSARNLWRFDDSHALTGVVDRDDADVNLSGVVDRSYSIRFVVP